MKFRIFSDLHLEFGLYDIPYKSDDYNSVLILAGDIVTSERLIHNSVMSWFEDISDRFKEVIYVAGNHEHYHSDYYVSMDRLKETMLEYDIDFLENEIIEIDGFKIAGCTLWSNTESSEMLVYKSMNDYRLIYEQEKQPIHPEFTNQLHRSSVNFLKNNDYDIVVTHHAPCFLSCGEYKNDPLSIAYATDLTNIMDSKKPSLWIHGHNHLYNQYQVYDTLVVSNPKGYPNENTGFKPMLEVEL